MKSFLKIEGRMVQWLSEGYQRRLLRAAVRSGYATFAEWHPQWAQSLFDEDFVMTSLLPLLESAIHEGVTVTPYQIALLWSQQANQTPDRQLHHSAAILSASKQFMALVAEAMADSSQPSETMERIADTPRPRNRLGQEVHGLV
jgi:hypothetical protein